MKLTSYFRQLKKFIVSNKQFAFEGIKNPVYYHYNDKLFLKFLLVGLFKNEFQIKFGSNYWKHVPKYIFYSLPNYMFDLIWYYIDLLFSKKKDRQKVALFKPSKPCSPKFLATHLSVNEDILENIVERYGFKIADEKLFLRKSMYIIKIQ